MANLLKAFTETFRLMGLIFLRSESNSHCGSHPYGWCTADGHGPNGLRHRRGIPAIQIMDFLRKFPLVEDPHPISLPFNGFKFHTVFS
jgi:hypothetical protein